MEDNNKIKEYYDTISSTYDESRFDNTYGRYIHQQEYEILKKRIAASDPEKTLDLGCGTGRFLALADYGVDISPKMLEEAMRKYPGKHLFLHDAGDTGFEPGFFDLVFSFHVVM